MMSNKYFNTLIRGEKLSLWAIWLLYGVHGLFWLIWSGISRKWYPPLRKGIINNTANYSRTSICVLKLVWHTCHTKLSKSFTTHRAQPFRSGGTAKATKIINKQNTPYLGYSQCRGYGEVYWCCGCVSKGHHPSKRSDIVSSGSIFWHKHTRCRSII